MNDSELPSPAPTDPSDELRGRIVQLEHVVDQLRSQISRLDSPFGRVFVARQTDDGDNTWTERTVNGGALEDFLDGRYVDDDGDPGAMLDMEGDDVLAIEIPDGLDHRYLRVDTGSMRISGCEIDFTKVKKLTLGSAFAFTVVDEATGHYSLDLPISATSPLIATPVACGGYVLSLAGSCTSITYMTGASVSCSAGKVTLTPTTDTKSVIVCS